MARTLGSSWTDPERRSDLGSVLVLAVIRLQHIRRLPLMPNRTLPATCKELALGVSMKYPCPPIDARGRRVRAGNRVRIVGLPDLSGMRQPHRRDSEAVFRHILGACKRVSGFDEYGCAEIFFAIRHGRSRGLHSVALEPYLLLVQAEPSRHRGRTKRI